MRTVLRMMFSRYGIIVIILLLVVGIIALAQSREDGPLGSPSLNGNSDTSEPASDEDTFDDGVATPNCEQVDCDEDGSPLHDPFETPELPEEAIEQALLFTEAWLDWEGATSDDWFDGMVPYMTADAAELMRGVPPDSVPANEVAGDEEASDGRVSIPLDTGTLILSMAEGESLWGNQGWLVSAVDWEPS